MTISEPTDAAERLYALALRAGATSTMKSPERQALRDAATPLTILTLIDGLRASLAAEARLRTEVASLKATQAAAPRADPARIQQDALTMDGPTMLDALRDDAAKWATAFCQHAVKLGIEGIDEGWMISWFANAIEHSHDVRTGRSYAVLPDGSAFFTGEIRSAT